MRTPLMGFPSTPFRLCDFWAIHSEIWNGDTLAVTGELPGGGLAVATFNRQSAPMGSWQAASLTEKTE